MANNLEHEEDGQGGGSAAGALKEIGKAAAGGAVLEGAKEVYKLIHSNGQELGEYSSSSEAESALRNAIANASTPEDAEDLREIEIRKVSDALPQQAAPTVKDGVFPATNKRMRENVVGIDDDGNYIPPQEGPLESTLKDVGAVVGDGLSLPLRVFGGGVDWALGNIPRTTDGFLQSLGQRFSESGKTPMGEDRNMGGQIVQGILRDPTMLPLTVATTGAYPAVTGALRGINALRNVPTVQKILSGAALGGAAGAAAGATRPALENEELRGGDVALETGLGAGLGMGLPLLVKGFRKATAMRDPDINAWTKRAQDYADINFQDNANPRNAEILMDATDGAKLAEMRKNHGAQEKIAQDIADLKFIPEEQLPGFEAWNDAIAKSTGKITPTSVVDHLSNYDQRVMQELGESMGTGSADTKTIKRINAELPMFLKKELPQETPPEPLLKFKENPTFSTDEAGNIDYRQVDLNPPPPAETPLMPLSANTREMTIPQLNAVKKRLGDVVDWDALIPAQTDYVVPELKTAYGMINGLIDEKLAAEGLGGGTMGRAQMSHALKARDALFAALRAGTDKNKIADNVERNTRGVGIGRGATTEHIEKKLKELGNVFPQAVTIFDDLTRANQASKLLMPDGQIGNHSFITTGKNPGSFFQRVKSLDPARIIGGNPSDAVNALKRTNPNAPPGIIERNIEALPQTARAGAISTQTDERRVIEADRRAQELGLVPGSSGYNNFVHSYLNATYMPLQVGGQSVQRKEDR